MFFTLCVYNLIFLSVYGNGLILERSKKPINAYLSRTFMFLSMAFPASIRYNTGKDYMGYVLGFKEISSGMDSSHYELGFKFICRGIDVLGLNYQWLFVIYSIIIYFPICYLIPRKNASIFMSLYILVMYLGSLSVIRQSAAITFIICAFFSIMKYNSYLRYAIWIGIACLMHMSAIVFLPFVFLIKMHYNSFKAIILLVLSLIFVSEISIIELIFNNSIFLDSKYGSYATNEQFLSETSIGSGIGIMIKLFLPALFILLSYKIPYKYHIFIPVAISYIILVYIGLNVYIFNRFVGLFSFIICFICKPICDCFAVRYRKLVILSIILGYLVLFQKDIISNPVSKFGGLGCSPYTTIFQ